MRPAIVGAALLLGCQDDTGSATGTEPTGPQFEQVMRDCPTDVGNICPYAGAGYNGVLTGTHHLLDQWFSFPMSLTWPQGGGNPVAADWNNHRLIELVVDDPEAGIRVVMGTQFLGDGDPELADRTAAGALGTDISLNHPTMQVFQENGLMLSDSWHTHKFREEDVSTLMTRVVLGTRPGLATYDADSDPNTPAVPWEFDQPEAAALLNQPKELFLDPNDDQLVYFVDMRNERIRLWDRHTAMVNTIAGKGTKGYCGDGGDALQACFGFPKNANPEPGGAIAVLSDSNTMFIADSENHVIRKLDLDAGTITLFSGSAPTMEDTDSDPNTAAVLVAHPGHHDGPAAEATWSYPADFALDEATNSLFVADANNNAIRRIDLVTNEVTTVAGTGEATCIGTNPLTQPVTSSTTVTDPAAPPLVPLACDEQHHGGDGGPATEATLYRPFGVDLDSNGDLVISDTDSHRFRIVYR